MEDFVVILFYKFVNIENPKRMMKDQRKLCEDLELKGRILIGEEGINATLEGTQENIEKYKNELRGKWKELFGNVSFKESKGTGKAFTKLQVTVKDEIVKLGAGKFDVVKETAPTVTAEELQKMYENEEDFVVLDLRNDFEVQVGYFDKTVNPKLDNFRDLLGKIPELEHLKNTKVVAVCTGDIRCEKATCLLKKEGFENLYHLKDGIHDYMQKFPAKRFRGSLFVFDNRMTTPVVDDPNREIVGKCIYCSVPCEDFYSDDTTRPSKKIISCVSCAEEYSQILRRC